MRGSSDVNVVRYLKNTTASAAERTLKVAQLALMIVLSCTSPDFGMAESTQPLTANLSRGARLRTREMWLPDTVSRARPSTSAVDVIMLHFCSDVVSNPENPYDPARIAQLFTKAKVSAHYLIGRNGIVYKFVPEERIASHAGRGSVPWFPDRVNNMNEYSIGIEMLNVGSKADMSIFMSPDQYDEFKRRHPHWIGYTNAQYHALNLLIAEIRTRHNIPFDRTHIIGHSEYAGRHRRTDPGELFDWTRIGLPKELPKFVYPVWTGDALTSTTVGR
jgi:N-acetyl-anhydromuramyl-L-alanine amidase AmpD